MDPAFTIPTPWLLTSAKYRVLAAVRASLSWIGILLAVVVVAVVVPTVAGSFAGYFAFAPIAIAIVVAGALYSAGASFLAARSVRYQLCDEEIRYEAGVFTRRTMSLPYDRIQTVSAHNGMLDRLLGLSTIVCQSAADQSSIMLPGLTVSQAEETQALISEKARQSRADQRRGTL